MKKTLLSSLGTNVAEVELIYKTKVKHSELPRVTSASQAYDLFKSTWNENKLEFVEEFKVMLLNRSNRVLAICPISSGGITGTVADPRLIFISALRINAIFIILCHNHPSSSLIPSQADEILTQKIKQAGDFLDIKVLDHLIVTSESYYSFADEGKL